MSGLFEVIASEQHEERLAARKAVVLSNQRVDDRFGAFLRAAETDIEDYTSRLDLVRDDIKQVIAVACEEAGSDNADAITESILSRLTPQPVATRTASVEHEARKPKLCPYHKEVMDISLAQGEPRAGFDAMAQHAWGAQHCQGSEYEGGRCNFKREMVTQSYWDQKAEQAEQRRLEREQQRAEQAEHELEAEDAVEEAPEEAVEEADELPDNVVELHPEEPTDTEPTITDELTEAPTAVGIGSEDSLAVAASADEVPLAHKEAEQKKHLEGDKVTDKRQRQYEHIKERCLEDGKSEDECKELAARTVNKQRSEKGETESHVKEAWGNPGDGYADLEHERPQELYDEPEGCPQCGSLRYEHGECLDCGYQRPLTQHELYPEPRYHGYASVREAEALKTIDVDKDGEGPVPKIDKRPIDQLPDAPDTEGEGSPVPTRRKDVTQAIEFEESNRENPQETDAVLEKQDVTKDTGPKPVSSSFLPPDELRSVIASFHDE